jgi:transposase
MSSHSKKEKTMPDTSTPHYVGLDIGKDKLDYSITDTEEGSCANSPEGRGSLIKRLLKLSAPRVVCEASGGYEKLIVAELLAAGIEVCVVQPVRVRAYANAEGLLAKTDRIDARLLRRFGKSINPRLAVPTDESSAVLRELIEHRRKLTTQLTEVQERRALAGRTLDKLLQHHGTFLKKEIDAVDRLIEEHIDNDPDMRSKSERLQQVRGIGPILAATALAYIPELGKLEDAQLSALLGVAPHPKDSCHCKAPRHVRGGRSQVRHVLYMAAVTASRCNPILSGFYQRLHSNGKPPKVCLIAVMRKLACLMNRLIADPNFVLVH